MSDQIKAIKWALDADYHDVKAAYYRIRALENELERVKVALAGAISERDALRVAGADCANDLEAYVNNEMPEVSRDNYPHIRRQYERCIAPVEALRKLLPSEIAEQDSDRNR